MPLVQENRHPNSLNFRNERKVVILRDQGKSFPAIREEVLNRNNEQPGLRTVADTYYKFKTRSGQRVFHYDNCGRKAWKLTKSVQAFLISTL